METKQIEEILKLHKMWLNNEDDGERADLSGAYLIFADLIFADLRSANLRSADLSGAYLSGADLRSADLRSADLRSADLRSADLIGADLSGADLRSADLRSADLRSADLIGANLRSADLSGADLSGAFIPMYCKWSHSIIDGKIRIGCKEKTPKEWDEWLDSNEVYSTVRGTQEFKQIEAVIRAYIAYLKVLND